jgi:HD-GYP domain-containing protein (c-di-GMP phosphodiesterase class II)
MDLVKQLIVKLTIALSNCSLYSTDHELIEEASRQIHSLLKECITGTVAIIIIEDDLIINQFPVRDGGIHVRNLVKRLKKKGISGVEFQQGVTAPEIKEFIADIAAAGPSVRAYPHIKTGVVDVTTRPLKSDSGFNLEEMPHFNDDQIDKLKEIYHNLSPFKKLSVAGLEEIVAGFVSAFRRETNILGLLSPVKSLSNHTYVHSSNVAVLSVFQAETMGIKDSVLHDIGLAAILHDVGKLFVSREVLEKDGPLDEREFAEMMLHPVYGANYLAKIDGITSIAPVVAYEHHRKYDGTGYPKTRAPGRTQHICSQIIAISDFFDALRCHRPYRRSWNMQEIIVLMKRNAGKDFNPLLVNNFVRGMTTVLADA